MSTDERLEKLIDLNLELLDALLTANTQHGDSTFDAQDHEILEDIETKLHNLKYGNS